jgi:hypothetical protein
MGNIALTNVQLDVIGSWRQAYADGAGSTSYAAGGDSIVLSELGLGLIEDMTILPTNESGGLIFQYDRTNRKIMMFYPTGGGGTNPTTVATDPILESGPNAVTSANATARINPGRAKEVPATANVSTIKFRVQARGRL